MNGNAEELLILGHRVQNLANCLFNDLVAANPIDLERLTAAMGEGEGEIVSLLRRLSAKEIIELEGQRVRLLAVGKRLYEEQCIPDVVLGVPYVNAKYKAAVVRVVVRNRNGDPAWGTGFFLRDRANCIVTNRHVVEEHAILQIEDLTHHVLTERVGQITLAPTEELDLAVIECDLPAHISPIPIDWSRDAVRELEQVLVLGYPHIPMHQPALYHAVGNVGVRGSLLNGEESLVISDVASAGSSGSPVINVKGKVAGIVARQMEMQGVARTFVSAIPSYYLEQLVPRVEA